MPRPRPKNVSCPTCARLYEATGKHQRPGYVRMSRLGSPAGPPMRRIYARASSGTYEAIGYICDAGHVVLDQPANGPGHVLTPMFPPSVLCVATGETVSVPR